MLARTIHERQEGREEGKLSFFPTRGRRQTLLDVWVATLGSWVQPVLLLVIRFYWGWSFFLTGTGKLLNLEKTTAFFTELNLPLPKLNALMAGSAECVGGLLLMPGLGSRLVSVPLMATMGVADATAHRGEAGKMFSDSDTFTEAAPFLFLRASAIVFVVGLGQLWSTRTGMKNGHVSV